MKKINFLVLLSSIMVLAACDHQTSESVSVTDSSSGNVNSSSVDANSSSVNQDGSNSSTIDSSLSDSSSNDSSSSEVVANEYEVLPNWDRVDLEFSMGSDLLDVAVGRPYMTGATYDLSYTMNSTIPSDPTKEIAISSNEKVFTVERNGTGFKLHAHHAGQAMIRITDSNNIIRFCEIIVVKDAIPLDYMEEYLVYDCEYWKSVMSWTDDYVITFNEGNQYTVSGRIENVPFEPITGTYEYVGTLNDGKEYEYKFTDTDIANVGLTGFHVATVGSFMYLQGNYGTEAILKPTNEIPTE